ncbi:MAG TPA: inorganic diphosphatase [Bellilinea sp.]|nr:inorganic diphosphatase [Bellilinea sp.]
MNTCQYIGQTLQVVIDRPLGSRHAQHGFLYQLNYGYLPGVPSDDGEDLDAYVLGVFEPISSFEGECIAVIHRLDDSDDKLVLAPPGRQFTDDQIRALTKFQERWFASIIKRT